MYKSIIMPTCARALIRQHTSWALFNHFKSQQEDQKLDVEADLRAMKITNWKTSTEDKLAWEKIVEQAKTHPGL
jgi:hypothetical protein